MYNIYKYWFDVYDYELHKSRDCALPFSKQMSIFILVIVDCEISNSLSQLNELVIL